MAFVQKPNKSPASQRSPGVKVVDRGPKWGAKRGFKTPGSGLKARTPTTGTPLQLTRQFNAFEFHVRSFSQSEIARILKCTEDTVKTDIAFEFERRKGMHAGGREGFIQRAFFTLESVKQMNFEVLAATGGQSKSGHEYKSIIGAIALQARLMGYEAPRKFDARIEGMIDHNVLLGLPEIPRQLPEEFTTTLLYAIAESAGYRGDPRMDADRIGAGALTLGPADGALQYIGPTGEECALDADAGATPDVGPQATGEPSPAE
jgi:hypothetical protein